MKQIFIKFKDFPHCAGEAVSCVIQHACQIRIQDHKWGSAFVGCLVGCGKEYNDGKKQAFEMFKGVNQHTLNQHTIYKNFLKNSLLFHPPIIL